MSIISGAIEVHPSGMSCKIGDYELVAGDRVEYKRYGGKIVKGKVVAFALVDKKDMKSPWVYLTETQSKVSDWYPLVSMTLLAYHKATVLKDDEADEMKGLFSQQAGIEPEGGDFDGMF